MNDTTREMVWKVEPKPKKTSKSATALKKEMNDLKKEFNKLSQFMMQNLVTLESEMVLLKQENEKLKTKVKKIEETPSASHLPNGQLPALNGIFLA